MPSKSDTAIIASTTPMVSPLDSMPLLLMTKQQKHVNKAKRLSDLIRAHRQLFHDNTISPRQDNYLIGSTRSRKPSEWQLSKKNIGEHGDAKKSCRCPAFSKQLLRLDDSDSSASYWTSRHTDSRRSLFYGSESTLMGKVECKRIIDIQ